jgi:glycerol-3-phosphate dehydrogenase
MAYDVAVIGGGVVGLAVAREMAVRGRSVVLLEREDAPAAGASSGNSGIGCTGYDAPVGSLERRLLRRAIQLHPALLRSFGMSYEHVRKCGSLVVAWTPEELAKLPSIVAENFEAGDTEAVQLSAAELHELEPSLSTKALGAVLCPREAIVEPWLVPAGYAHSATINGAKLRLNREVTAVDYSPGDQLWHLKTCQATSAPSGRSAPGTLLVPKLEHESQPQRRRAVVVRTMSFIVLLYRTRIHRQAL